MPRGMDPNWNRWIFASVSSQFSTVAQANGLPLFVEGTDKPGRRLDKDYAEFRMNGPFATELSASFWELLFDVNVLVCSMEDTTSIHRVYRNVGIVTTMFLGALEIRRLGSNDPDPDDQGLLDCALLETEGANGGVLINHFGRFDATLPVLQSTVEGSYKLYLPGAS